MADKRKRRRRHKDKERRTSGRRGKRSHGRHSSELWESLRAKCPDHYTIPDPAFVEVLARWGKKRGGDSSGE